jgi:hypothetical protein
MSLIEVPRIGSMWENPKQPGQVVQVVGVHLRRVESYVVMQWGTSADIAAYPLNKFLEIFRERGQ